jgi:hypothetical protein
VCLSHASGNSSSNSLYAKTAFLSVDLKPACLKSTEPCQGMKEIQPSEPETSLF